MAIRRKALYSLYGLWSYFDTLSYWHDYKAQLSMYRFINLNTTGTHMSSWLHIRSFTFDLSVALSQRHLHLVWLQQGPSNHAMNAAISWTYQLGWSWHLKLTGDFHWHYYRCYILLSKTWDQGSSQFWFLHHGTQYRHSIITIWPAFICANDMVARLTSLHLIKTRHKSK